MFPCSTRKQGLMSRGAGFEVLGAHVSAELVMVDCSGLICGLLFFDTAISADALIETLERDGLTENSRLSAVRARCLITGRVHVRGRHTGIMPRSCAA